jgi:hypothetical protein
MSFFGKFCYFSVIIVTIQIIRSVIPWIYENFLGPAFFGSSIKFKEFGESFPSNANVSGNFLSKLKNIYSYLFVVVTGAGGGIGKAYSLQVS